MAKAITYDQQQGILRLRWAGYSVKETAKLAGRAESTVRKVEAEQTRDKTWAPGPEFFNMLHRR